MYRSSQVTVSELVVGLAMVKTTSIVLTGITSGLAASGLFSTTKEKKPTWYKPTQEKRKKQ